MLQGMARGKVGDVVFSRLNGEQIARVRNRNPKNPKTNAQLYQRAIMATVMQAYSAGRKIFDHAFQGYSVGEANQRRFMSVNAKHLRGLVAADLTNNTTEAAVVGPGISSPVPCPLIVSDGTYTQQTFEGLCSMPAVGDNETYASYYAKANLVPGDIHTIVVFAEVQGADPLFEVNGVDDALSKQMPTTFAFMRLQVKQYANGATAITEEDPISNIFDMTDSYGLKSNFDFTEEELRHIHSSFSYAVPTIILDAFVSATQPACLGVIRSRIDEDLRSRCQLAHINYQNSVVYNGIAAKYLLDAWKQGSVKVGNSDLILEGGDV